MNVLKPRQPTPGLDIETLDGHWSLAAANPRTFTMIVFYRGYHCPVCRNYIKELNRVAGDFAERGIELVAVSSDTRERAALTRTEWELDALNIGLGLTVAQAREFGLHRSAGRGKTSAGIEEPAEFNEPGLFLLRPDGTLYWSSISTMPFARPHFREILAAIDFAVERDYPARGELS